MSGDGWVGDQYSEDMWESWESWESSEPSHDGLRRSSSSSGSSDDEAAEQRAYWGHQPNVETESSDHATEAIPSRRPHLGGGGEPFADAATANPPAHLAGRAVGAYPGTKLPGGALMSAMSSVRHQR